MEEIRNELQRLNSEDKLTAMDCLNLLELIVKHLEIPKTVNINLENLVSTLNVTGTQEDAEEVRKMVTEALIKALKAKD